MVGAKIVEKHTFLHLEPEHGTTDDCTLLKPRARSLSDTFVDYGSDMASEENSTTAGSPKLSPRSNPSEQLSNSDNEETSSQATDIEDPRKLQWSANDQPMVAPMISAPQQFYLGYDSMGSPCYYMAMSAWGQTNMCANPQGATPPNAAATQADQWEAHAAELRAQAARLKAQAAEGETQALQALQALRGEPVAPQGMASHCTWAQAPRQASGIQSQNAKRCEGNPASFQTTLMMRNIPNDYTRAMLLELLDCIGLAGKYDFVYLPIDFDRVAGLGYCFVNFVSNADAESAKLSLQGFSQWKVQSQKICEVRWGQPLQGLEAHIERYRSSPVMHRDVPDDFKPIILQGGVRVPFPAPTKRLRQPRAKRDF